MDAIEARNRLELMIDRYQRLVLTICYKTTGDYFAAQDLAQETFLSAYTHLDSFDGANEKAWLCRIAANKCTDYLKSAGRRQIPSQEDSFAGLVSERPSPEQQALDREVGERLLYHCKRLKPPYDEIARLYFYEERRPDEIARLTGRNVRTVQTQIYRARDSLRKIYRKECG